MNRTTFVGNNGHNELNRATFVSNKGSMNDAEILLLATKPNINDADMLLQTTKTRTCWKERHCSLRRPELVKGNTSVDYKCINLCNDVVL